MIGTCGLTADLATHVDARHVRQSEVEDDEIGPARCGRAHTVGSVGRFVHATGDIAQRVANGAADLRFIIDHEHEISVCRGHSVFGGRLKSTCTNPEDLGWIESGHIRDRSRPRDLGTSRHGTVVVGLREYHCRPK
jgi:hypothetical protein